MRGPEIRPVAGLLSRALPADADRGMAEEDLQSDVREERVLDVRLHVLRRRRLCPPDAEEAHELVEVAAAKDGDAAGPDCGDEDDGREPPGVERASPPGDECDGDRGRYEAGRRRRRARGDQAEHAGDDARRGERPVDAPRRDYQRGQPGCERRAGKRRKVVMSHERRLPPSRRPGLGDRPAEELRDPNRRRDRAPSDERREQHPELAPPAEQQRQREREHAVLGELPGRDDVPVPVVRAVRQERIERREEDHRQECGAGDPDRQPVAKRAEAPAEAGKERGEPDREHREVGEVDGDACRAGVEREARLVVRVQEDQREGEGEHGSAERDDRPLEGGRARCQPLAPARGGRRANDCRGQVA